MLTRTRPNWFDRIDRRIPETMAEHGLMLLRVALSVVFFWFGVLKFFPGASPAEALAGKTIETLTFGAISQGTALMILAVWQSAIGIGLFVGRWMRAVLLLLFIQMLGTITPLFLKNVVIVSAAIVLGATVRGGELSAEPVVATSATET